MAHGEWKDLPREAVFYKVSSDKSDDIAKTPNFSGFKYWLAMIVYKFLIKCLEILLWEKEAFFLEQNPLQFMKNNDCKRIA